MIHERISLVFILLLDIAPNFNIYEDICYAQPSSEHISSYAKCILCPRLRGSVSSVSKVYDGKVIYVFSNREHDSVCSILTKIEDVHRVSDGNVNYILYIANSRMHISAYR